MTHPSALVGKSTHSLIDIARNVLDLIFREYNRDAKPGGISYRDPGMPPFRGKHLGIPAAGVVSLPAVSVGIASTVYQDSPQDAGSDDLAEVKIYLFGREKKQTGQFVEAVRMAEAVRHVILDNPNMRNKDGTEGIYQLGYGEMRIDFTEEVFENFQGSTVGVEIAIITANAVFAEKGF